MQGMATTAYTQVLLGAMTMQMTHLLGRLTCTPRSHDKADDALYSVAFLYYLLALAGSILTLYPLIKFLFIAPITFSATSSGTSTKVNLS